MTIGLEDVVRTQAINAAIVHQVETDEANKMRAKLKAADQALTDALDKLAAANTEINRLKKLAGETP